MTAARVTLHLIRHAESLWNVEEKYQGQGDSGLTRAGREQADAVGDWLVQMLPHVDMVVASDLPRVRNTAGPLATTLGMELVVDQRLREVDIGTWSGRSFEDVARAEPEIVAATAAGADVARGGGETFAQTRTRVVAALDDLVEAARGRESEDQIVVIFTHGGPIRVATADALGMPSPGHARIGPPANCSVTTLEQDGPARRLLRYNRPTVVGVTASRNVREHEMAGLT